MCIYTNVYGSILEKKVREAGEKKLEELHKEIQTLQDACDEQERQLNDRLQSLKTQIASEVTF